MGVWTWTKGVIADRGEHEPIPIHLERTAGGHGYAFRLGVRAGIGGQDTARIPVRSRPNEAPHPILKEVHYCEIGGRTLEAANVYALRSKVERQLEQIAPGRTLPIAYFRSPRMDYELPVYEEHGEFISPVIGGPRIRARDLAGVRVSVCRYLISAGYVRDAEEVEVGVLRPRDLRRVPPASVFRCLESGSELWLPSVEGTSPDGPVVGVLGHAHVLQRAVRRRRRPAGPAAPDRAPAAPDVVALLRLVRAELARSGREPEAEATFASEVRPEVWADAEGRTEDSGTRLVAYLSDDEATRLELAVRRTGAGDLATALVDRGINVFLAPGADALASLVGRYLAGHDFLRFEQEVEIHALEAPRADRLEADAIRTFGDGVSVAAEQPKEAHPSWS